MEKIHIFLSERGTLKNRSRQKNPIRHTQPGHESYCHRDVRWQPKMIEKISTSQFPAYISSTFPSYEALSEGFKSDKTPYVSSRDTRRFIGINQHTAFNLFNTRGGHRSQVRIFEGRGQTKGRSGKNRPFSTGALSRVTAAEKNGLRFPFETLPATAPSHVRQRKSGCRFRGMPFGAPRPPGRAAEVRRGCGRQDRDRSPDGPFLTGGCRMPIPRRQEQWRGAERRPPP